MRGFTKEGEGKDGRHHGVPLGPYVDIGDQAAAGAFGVAAGGICLHLPSLKQQFPNVHILLGQEFLMSLGETEPNPGRLSKSPDGPHPTPLDAGEPTEVPVTAAGHTVRDNESTVPTSGK